MAVKMSAVQWEGLEGESFENFLWQGKEGIVWPCVEFEGQRESPMEMNWGYIEGEMKYRTQEKQICLFVTV
jgi:hypothetical protein